MGIVVLPLVFLAFLFWGLNGYYLLSRYSDYAVSALSLILAPIFSVLVLFIALNSFISSGTAWIYSILLALLIALFLMGIVGLIGVYIPKNYKWLNIIGFAISFGVVLLGVTLVISAFTVDIHQLLGITITH